MLQRLVMSVHISLTTVLASTSSLPVCFSFHFFIPAAFAYVLVSGLNILSTYIGSTHAVSTLSGTSMASPHTAGLLAYLLSIYPSNQFDPLVEPTVLANPLVFPESQRTFSSNVYAVAHAVLPRWVSAFMPSPRLVEIMNAPIPGKPRTLTPKQLKTALIQLSTSEVLGGLPDQTVNLLIFNNATRS